MLASAADVLIFIDGYPLEQVGLVGRPYSDRPEPVQILALVAGAA